MQKKYNGPSVKKENTKCIFKSISDLNKIFSFRRYFPFDQQDCSIVIGAWIYNSNKMNVTNVSNKMTIDNFTVNGGENDLNDPRAFPVKLCCGLNRSLQFKQLESNILGLHSLFTTSCSLDSIV